MNRRCVWSHGENGHDNDDGGSASMSASAEQSHSGHGLEEDLVPDSSDRYEGMPFIHFQGRKFRQCPVQMCKEDVM